MAKPKRYVDDNGCAIPVVHWDEIVKRNGEILYMGEIHTGAGTHSVALDKEKVDKGEIKILNPKGKGGSHSFYKKIKGQEN